MLSCWWQMSVTKTRLKISKFSEKSAWSKKINGQMYIFMKTKNCKKSGSMRAQNKLIWNFVEQFPFIESVTDWARENSHVWSSKKNFSIMLKYSMKGLPWRFSNFAYSQSLNSGLKIQFRFHCHKWPISIGNRTILFTLFWCKCSNFDYFWMSTTLLIRIKVYHGHFTSICI